MVERPWLQRRSYGQRLYWIKKNGGLCTEELIYTSALLALQEHAQHMRPGFWNNISSYYDVPANSDEDMMGALNKPVSIAWADQKDFQLYSSGVFTGSCGTQLDHGVLAVGYGTMDSTDYYRVKIPGTTWGKDGYIYLGRGRVQQRQGQCGMSTGNYPNVE